MRFKNKFDDFFQITAQGSSIRTEIIAGLTTFFAMSYIIFVNPNILSDPLYLMNDPNAEAIKGAVFVATCLSATIGCFLMGLLAKLPVAQAAGMGLNAFFAYTIVLNMGYSFNQALAAVFISGVLFIIITAFGLRQMITESLPKNMRFAISAGIGLFITLIGLKNSGLIVSDENTLVKLIHFATWDMGSKTAIVALIGLLISFSLMIFKFKGAIFIGIILTTIVGIPFGVTDLSAIASGQIFSMPPSIAPTFGGFLEGLTSLFSGDIVASLLSLFMIVISFTLIALFDSIGTLIGVASRANLLDDKGKMPQMGKALMSDAIATTVGSILGTSTVTAYVESGAGVAQGGRTGLTAITTGICFLLALFVSPLLTVIPAAATAPALIIVGVLMLENVKKIDMTDLSEWFPGFLTIIMMPFTYSIATGISFGIISYVLLKLVSGQGKKVHPVMYVLAALFILRYAIMPV